MGVQFVDGFEQGGGSVVAVVIAANWAACWGSLSFLVGSRLSVGMQARMGSVQGSRCICICGWLFSAGGAVWHSSVCLCGVAVI